MAAHIIAHSPSDSAKITTREAGLLKRAGSASPDLSNREVDLEIILASIGFPVPVTCSGREFLRTLLRPGHIARPRVKGPSENASTCSSGESGIACSFNDPDTDPC